jgi:serine/threonine-protein kinase SRPK3
MIQEHIDLLGELPPEWSQKWEAMPKWLNVKEDDECWPWEKRFEFSSMQEPRRKLGMKKVGEEEKAALLVMLKAMVTYKAGERMTAEEVRQSEWMTEWAMPELLRVDFLTDRRSCNRYDTTSLHYWNNECPEF